MKLSKTVLFAGLLSIGLVGAVSAAVNEDAAAALAKKEGCLKCHAVDKTKKGPSFQSVAAKYKGKADGEAKVVEMITTGKKAKFSDGTEEDHKIIDTKDAAERKNLVDWILSR